MPNQNEYTVRILNESDITAEIDASIRQLLIACFPHRSEEFSHCRWLDNNTPDFTTIVEHGGKQRMPIREYYPGEKPYRMCYVEDPFGLIFEVYSHSYELTYSQGAY